MATLAPPIIEVVRFAAPLGAEIRGVDLSRLDDATFAEIKLAWLTNKGLRLRDRSIDDDALAKFSRRFGPLDKAPITRSGRPHQPTQPEFTWVQQWRTSPWPRRSRVH